MRSRLRSVVALALTIGIIGGILNVLAKWFPSDQNRVTATIDG